MVSPCSTKLVGSDVRRANAMAAFENRPDQRYGQCQNGEHQAGGVKADGSLVAPEAPQQRTLREIAAEAARKA